MSFGCVKAGLPIRNINTPALNSLCEMNALKAIGLGSKPVGGSNLATLLCLTVIDVSD